MQGTPFEQCKQCAFRTDTPTTPADRPGEGGCMHPRVSPEKK